MSASINWDWVAGLYDTYVTLTLDLPFFLQEATATRGDVLELMCGTGRVSLALAEAGVELTCVDSSGAMLARLHNKLAVKNLSAHVLQMDVRLLDLGSQFDLIILPFNSFGELTSQIDQLNVLTRIYEHLRPGGRFICTLHNPPIRRQSADGQLRLLGMFPLVERAATLLVWTLATYDSASHIVSGCQFYEEYTTDGVLERKRMLDMKFALLDRDEFESLATAAGFMVASLYGDYERAPFQHETSPFMIWILQK